jgi:predicted transposase/invertase (TIGR01784 family)
MEFSESSEAQAEKRFRTESSQVYGIASYDALFKYVLSYNNVRPSFFHAFVPNLEIQSSERLDEHMNPLETFQLLRDFLHKKDHNTHIKLLAQSDFKVVSRDELGNERDDVPATQIMKEFVGRFEELKLAFPKPHYSGTMDFVCQLRNGDYAMIEMQVIPQNYWDRRALAYVAAFYGNQLKKGGDWKDIRRVIGINILGGGKDSKVHWENTSNQFIRHYKVQEQLHQPAQFIDGIELVQYSIMNSPEALSSQEVQDWVTFFKRGHFMSEEEVVSTIKTPEVLQAFERAKISKLPGEVRLAYEEEDREYDRYSQHTEDLVDKAETKGRTEGREEEKRAIALNLMTMTTLSDLEIAQGTGLSETGVQLLRYKKK